MERLVVPASFARIRAGCFAVLGLLMGGCGSAAPPVGESQVSPAVATAPAAGTADQAILTVIEGLRENRLVALWDFLPPSQQRDANGLVHEFARRMDHDLWGRSMQTLRELARVLKAQQQRLPPEEAAPDWEGLAALLDTIVASDLGDLERLSRVDARTFLATTGQRLMEQLAYFSVLSYDDPFASRLADFSQMQVSLQSATADSAVVVVDSAEGQRQTIDFVRIEGHWIPQALADGWIEAMGEARARLSLLSPESFAQVKPRWLALLKTADSAVERLSLARDPTQFEQAFESVKFSLQPLLGMLIGGLPEPEVDQPLPADDDAPQASDLVTLLVEGELDDGAIITIQDELRTALSQSERPFLEWIGDDRTTSFRLGPVADVAAFARKLEFLKIERVDEMSRTITAKLSR